MKQSTKIFTAFTLLVLLLLVGFQYIKYQTKRASPDEVVKFEDGELQLEVFYSRPFKKGRVIFGELVPYGKVWRTGANEATTFKTNGKLVIDHKELSPGNYTLWTIPGPKSWKIIFNNRQYSWGVDYDQLALRKPEFDVLQITVPVKRIPTLEQFKIDFLKKSKTVFLTFAWDDVQVMVPIKY